MFISIQRYGVSWMIKPFVVVMFFMAGLSLLRPLLQDIRGHGGLKNMVSQWGHPQFSPNNLFPAALLCLFVAMLSQSFGWAFAARIIPTIVGIGAILFCSLSLINDVFGLHERNGGGALAGKSQKIHMDIASKTAHLPTKVILTRGFLFFGWMAGFAACMALIGLIPTVPVFIIAFMRAEGREPWKIVIPMAAMRGAVDLRGVRPTAGDSMAADLGGDAVPGPENHPKRVRPNNRVTSNGRGSCPALLSRNCRRGCRRGRRRRRCRR